VSHLNSQSYQSIEPEAKNLIYYQEKYCSKSSNNDDHH